MKINSLKFESKHRLTLNEDIVTISALVGALTMIILIAKDELDAYLAHRRSVELANEIKKIIHENPKGSEKFFNHLINWTAGNNFNLLITLEKIVNDCIMGSGKISPEDVEELNSPIIRSEAKRKLMIFSADIQDPDEKKFINGLMDVIGI